MIVPAELYASLYAKEFPAQALLRLRPDMQHRPCAVIEGEPPLQHVCAINRAARRLGVARGMTRVELDAFPSVAVLLRSANEESAAKAALLECAGTFSPRVEDRSTEREFLCVIDIAGTERLLGTPEVLARTLLDRVKALGVTACVAVSRNFHAAICLARGVAAGATITIVPAGEESAALARLTVGVLDLSDEQEETFSSWGIRTLGGLAGLPEAQLIARMGQEGRRLRQLAQGGLPHLFLPVEAAFTLEERFELDSPVEQLDSLLFVVGVMLEQLILRATDRALALASVTATLALERGGSHTRTVRPALPTNDRTLWIKLIHLDLEAHPPSAAILGLTLKAEPGRTPRTQLGLFSPQLPDPAKLDVTLARIGAIAGEGNVGRAVLKDSHAPDEFRMEPFVVPPASSMVAAPQAVRSALRQLRPPERAAVALRGQRPEAFYFRKKRYAVEKAYGPWRSGGSWWTPETWGMEQWDLVARAPDGALLCCCLTFDVAQSSWRITALYD